MMQMLPRLLNLTIVDKFKFYLLRRLPVSEARGGLYFEFIDCFYQALVEFRTNERGLGTLKNTKWYLTDWILWWRWRPRAPRRTEVIATDPSARVLSPGIHTRLV